MKTKKTRYYKNIGLGFKTPKEAIEGTYIDKKCPFTSNVSIRGRILKGVVKTFKMRRTLVIRRDYVHYIKKYNRFEKRHTTLAAHVSPCFRVKEGDSVVVGECRSVIESLLLKICRLYVHSPFFTRSHDSIRRCLSPRSSRVIVLLQPPLEDRLVQRHPDAVREQEGLQGWRWCQDLQQVLNAELFLSDLWA